jgi:hypothetical protein
MMLRFFILNDPPFYQVNLLILRNKIIGNIRFSTAVFLLSYNGKDPTKTFLKSGASTICGNNFLIVAIASSGLACESLNPFMEACTNAFTILSKPQVVLSDYLNAVFEPWPHAIMIIVIKLKKTIKIIERFFMRIPSEIGYAV